jgi:hypothetical protein
MVRIAEFSSSRHITILHGGILMENFTYHDWKIDLLGP